MTEQEKELIIKCIASVAWADGKLAQEEIDYLTRAVEKMGYTDAAKAKQLIETTKTVDSLDDIKKLPKEVRIQMLQFMYLMAAADSKITGKEEKAIKKVSDLTFNNWKPVKKWLKAYTEFIKQGKFLLVGDQHLA